MPTLAPPVPSTPPQSRHAADRSTLTEAERAAAQPDRACRA